MNRKWLFTAGIVMVLLLISIAASASTLDDVVFTKAGQEVYVLEPGDVSATVIISADAKENAMLITAAYEDKKLQNVKFESIELNATQKEYTGASVSVSANTTNVAVMVWNADFSPIGTKTELTDTSRQIKIEKFTVSKDSQKHYGYVDSAANKIYVEQTVDFYGPSGNYTKYYDTREADYISLSDSDVTYKLNGVDMTAKLSLESGTPAKLTATAQNGRTKIFDVVLEKHIAVNVANFNRGSREVGPPEDADGVNNQIILNTNEFLDKAQFYGERYGSMGIKAFCAIAGSDTEKYIENLQDITKEHAFVLNFVNNVGGKGEDDFAFKVQKKGNSSAFDPRISITQHAGGFGIEKTDISFDLFCEEADGVFLQANIADAIKLFFMNKDDDNYTINYVSVGNPGWEGYGKKLAVVKKNEWHNIRIIIDKNDPMPVTMAIDGQVLFKTDKLHMPGSVIADNFINYLTFHSYSSGEGTYCIDNLFTTYYQHSPGV